MNNLKKENKRRKEIIDSAIIKLEKKHLLERIEEKGWQVVMNYSI